MMGQGWGMGWGMGWGWIGMLLFSIFLILAIAWLFRALDLGGSAGSERDSSGDTALDVLRERYARGEIDREEFRNRKQDLES